MSLVARLRAYAANAFGLSAEPTAESVFGRRD